ncbi:MAG: hypothetical protein GY862_36705 [Gammaproteobacteria bacterium]|nr:hypothetical protein [Gammaproteobacteria bacterium]
MKFIISKEEIRKRNNNILLGLLFSLVLTAVVVIQNHNDPQQYSNTLLWSVIICVVLANLVNYYRHLRYVHLIRGHCIEAHPGKLCFRTRTETTELDTGDIAALRFFRDKTGVLKHIQIRLKNSRGIRLEGYANLDELAGLLTKEVPAESILK